MSMSSDSAQSRVQIGRSAKTHIRLGMGGSFYGLDHGSGQGEADILAAMATALDCGITHFDTATGYGGGYSERLIGRFLAADPSRRERIFLASKFSSDDLRAQTMIAAVDASRSRLQTDVIDLYYIHWPRTGKDLRPLMEGLETARQQGKIHAIGVSNFSVAQMEQIGEVGRIDAHQPGYNLLWRFAERDVIPYCRERGIAVVVYSALAHGILAGNYARQLQFVAGDQRWSITLFRDGIWQHIYDAVEAFKRTAERAGRPLPHLALRWLLRQPGVTSVLVSAKTPDQVIAHIPDEGNPFGYHP